MLFKLKTPLVDPQMQGAIVSKWHKAKGDHVGYGDDVVDLKVELALSAAGSWRNAAKSAIVIIARVTSSDVGVLRRIEAEEGDRREAGSLLAVLSTADHASKDIFNEDLSGASEFRVVANLVE
jgi:pyruvate/2-oxoglutarate dehydrogenase complex dihydrolipoamide acyltransferase (E2) component